MATYIELYGYKATEAGSTFRNRVAVACTKKAQTILDSASTQAAKDWALDALVNPTGKADTIMHYVLARYSSVTLQQISDAPDTGANSLQEAVDAAVDSIVAGGA